MPKLFWDTDEGKGAYTRGSSTAGGEVKPRAALEVPPELRADIDLPVSDKSVAAENAVQVPEKYRKAVAGKAVMLDVRHYEVQPGHLFSSVVDAMTSLSLPVDSVDSPSGVITTDWIRKGSLNPGGLLNLSNLMGTSTSTLVRYRYIVRVFRLNEDLSKSRLEVRLLNQVYINNHWVNKPKHSKRVLDLFTAVEKQLDLSRGP